MGRSSITRRRRLTSAAALLAAPWVVARSAWAETTLTIGENGGPVSASFREAFIDPYERSTGV
jgi:spermidine/putrescine-binding protein